MPAAAPSTTAASVAARSRVAPDTIQCFKAGSHVALSGAMLAFSAADLDATARAYDPALHEAPLVVGHPRTDGPAYGWVGALAHEANALEALPRQVNPEFAAMVNTGAFKKVSAAFWAPDAPGNPVPGVYYLRHIGFLGAAAPGVQGLRTPQFAGSDDGVVEFSAWADADNASLWRQLRDWMLAKFGQDEADRVLPAYLIGSVERDAQQEIADEAGQTSDAAAVPSPAFAAGTAAPAPHSAAAAAATTGSRAAASQETTPVDPKTAQALQAENEQLRQQLKDQASAGRQQRLDAAHADAVAFADGLVAQAQLAVAKRDLVVAALDALSQHGEDSGKVPMFAQGDAQVPLLPAVRTLLGKLPRSVAAGRVATVDAVGAAAVEASLAGNAAERRAAIAERFPDLQAGA